MDKYAERLTEHKKYIEQKGFDVAFYSLKGSQNYGISTENSDVDSYFVIMPRLEDLAISRQPISTGYKILGENDEEHITVKDIRVFFREAKNYDFTSLEILSSKYLVFEDKYQYAGSLLNNVNWFKKSSTALYRMKRKCNEFCLEIKNLDFDLKKDRKSFVRFLTDYNFLLNLSLQDFSFFVYSEEERNDLLSIKQGKYSKECALEKFPIFDMTEYIGKESFCSKFNLSSTFDIDLGKILYKFFETKFKEV